MGLTFYTVFTTLFSESSERAAKKRQKAQTPVMANLFFEAPPTLETTQAHQASMESSADALRDAKGRYQRMFGKARDVILILEGDQKSVTEVNPSLTPS